MTYVLKFLIQFLPWLLSFSAAKVIILCASAIAMCFGGYLYFTGQSAKATVEALRRENTGISRTKAAVELRVKTNGQVGSLEDDAKIKELSKWAK